MKEKLARARWPGIESGVKEIKGVKVLAAQVPAWTASSCAPWSIRLRVKWKTTVVVLASAEDSNVVHRVGVTKDLTSKVHAGKLAGPSRRPSAEKAAGVPTWPRPAARIPAALAGALDAVYTTVEGML